MDASLAATGIFDVLTMSTVLSINFLFVHGSFNSSNSSMSSAVSFPLSPQPTYTTISTSANFAIDCSRIVLPVPNPPGRIAVPPLAIVKRKSIAR